MKETKTGRDKTRRDGTGQAGRKGQDGEGEKRNEYLFV